MTSFKTQTKAKIQSLLPLTYKPVSERTLEKGHSLQLETKIVRKMFGKSLMPLTTPLLNKLKGCDVYVVSGQGWSDLASKASSPARRMRTVEKLRILDPAKLGDADKKKLGVRGEKKRGNKWVMRDGTRWWPVKTMYGKGYIYTYWKGDHYGSGSGCDPMWVFLPMHRD